MDFNDECVVLQLLSYNLDQLISKTRFEFVSGAEDQYHIGIDQVRRWFSCRNERHTLLSLHSILESIQDILG